MRSVVVWVEQLKEREETLCVHDIAFRPDGEQLIVATGTTVQVYSANDGKLLTSLKGHKDVVYCVSWSRDGENFVSGGADKQVIIWGGDPYEGKLKYAHSDSVQKVSYNPKSPLVLSCTNTDIGLWSPDYKKSVTKEKVSSRCCSCSWTNDGQYFAIGHHNGAVTFWTKAGVLVKEIAQSREFPVWSIAWNPLRDDNLDILTVCDWGQKISYYLLNSKQVGKDRVLTFDPTCVSHFPTGGFSIITGTDKKVNVYSREGVLLDVVGEMQSWPWACCVRPGKNPNQVAVGCQDGTLALYQLTFNTVHGLYKGRYAHREQMTEVVIQNLMSEDSVKIKCRDLVKKIAVYKNRLAMQLPERVIIYELTTDNSEDMMYKFKSKFDYKQDCSLLVACSSHIILCQDRTLQCLTMQGEKEREWVLDSQIRYIKVAGGPVARESILVGLRNGQVFRIFVNNPFPNLLLKQQVAIRCLDLSLNRTKLAVVDENNLLMVYDLTTKQLLYQEPNASSVAWNSQYEDMLCFSGNGYLNIKTSNFPLHQLKQQGFVVGFSGSKIFCLNYFAMTHVDVPQSVSMVQYLDRKNYREAYKIACLGVTESDWKILATDALEGMEFDIAKKAFIRVREMGYLELIHSIEERKKMGENNSQIFLADIYAYQGKFHEAAELYKKCKVENKAVEMYTDLREFELAKKYMTTANQDVKELIAKQADWAMNTNDPNVACDMYVAAGEYMKAVEIMGENGWTDRLTGLVHDLSKTEADVLKRCAHFFKTLSQPLSAAMVYEKLGDTAAVLGLYVESKQWDMAFELAKKHEQYRSMVYLPYAHWLMENDKFDEAFDAMCSAGSENQALQLLGDLAENAIKERRYNDAGYYYWLLAKSSQEATQRIDPASEDAANQMEMLTQQFYHNLDLADLYYVYHGIHSFIEQPFTSFMPEALLNMARYVVLRTLRDTPTGISRVTTLFTLSKQSRQLGAYKLARFAYEKLQSLQIPTSYQDAIEIGSLTIRSKPFQDKEDLLPMCYRCSTTNPLINSSGNICVNCKQPLEVSFVSFEVLPVVEFVLEEGISDDEAEKLLRKDPPAKKDPNKWKQTEEGTTQTLRLDDTPAEEVGEEEDPFQSTTFEDVDEFVPVVCGRQVLESLHRMEVIIKKWGPPIGNQYFKSVMPDVNLTVCNSCNKMFHSDDYEVQVLSKGHCPFCRSKVDSF